jgi:nitroimidazol reductase NimA-like FMN-containing flavoprotein (pyridoxamine 5'-phosphate oxidase superfamily)
LKGEQSILIQELTSEESLALLARTRFGRLGCAQGGQPYVVPFYFAYKNDCLYSFSTVGRKIEWMRANPLVCVEADEVVNSEKWASVIVFGRYEEIPDTPDAQNQRAFAHDLLTENPIWWEPGYVKTILHGAERPLVPVYFRIHVTEITGHRATP